MSELLMPLSDVNDLDEVCAVLGIQDSDTTPAEAVRELQAEIERLRAALPSQPAGDELLRLHDVASLCRLAAHQTNPLEEAYKQRWIDYDAAETAFRAALAAIRPQRVEWQPTHQHYKGGLYQKIGDGLHTETEAVVTIYRNLAGGLFARPKEMFDGTLPGGELRFTPIDSRPAAGTGGETTTKGEGR
jgi:hypothetical protein